MNKSAIKNFAIWARNKLIADISYRAGLIGITAEGISTALSQSTADTEFYDIGTDKPYSIAKEKIEQRRKLVEVIRSKEKDSDYKTAYKYIIEEVAYTWFNRLIAIRFMEVNDYLPSHVRVLSSDTGKLEPDMISSPFDAELEFTDREKEEILQLKTDNKLDELFCLLFIKQCNALNEYLPALFERTADYTELLLNLSVIDRDGVVYKLVHDIDEDDFNVEKGGQVEIIGWLYQYYNTEPKAEVFGRPSGTKIRKEDIPAATQLFTPDWIVRYMVENSLGRLWVEGHPNDELKANWKYYLEEAVQEAEVQEKLDEIRKEYANLDPEDIKIIDPCMGSGHILVYAFDVLMQIYESAGYGQRDAAKSILKNNIYGLDIDDRAFQLAYFAVMMKARQYNRRILSTEHKPNLYSIQESNGINREQLKYFGVGLSDEEKEKALGQMTALLDTFIDAKEYGSILTVEQYDWELLEHFVEASDDAGQIRMDNLHLDETAQELRQMLAQGKVLGEKYHVAVTNPPYAGSSNLSIKVNNYLKKNYPDSKADLFAVFIERCGHLIIENGYQAMITQHSWMFLGSFEIMRKNTLKFDIINMAHLGARAFDEIGGEVVQTTSFIIRSSSIQNYIGYYSRLLDGMSQKDKEDLFLSSRLEYSATIQEFNNIPGSPIAYWVSEGIVSAFSGKLLSDYADTKQGFATGDNDRFLRLWFETVESKTAVYLMNNSDNTLSSYKWLPCTKGGAYRKWYGNNSYVANWENNGQEMTAFKGAVIRNRQFYFREGISWSSLANQLSLRYTPKGFVFESKGSMCYSKGEINIKYLMALLNSKIASEILQVLSPTLDFHEGPMSKVPVIVSKNIDSVVRLVDDCINIAKENWDDIETSWDFEMHPLIKKGLRWSDVGAESASLYKYYNMRRLECEQCFNQLKSNEEELNRIFIDIYGLQDELTPDVADKDITVHRIFDSKEDVPESMKGSAYIRTKKDEIVSLLSYFIGCMFGRYSLDTEGLAYAGGEWDETKYKKFKPNPDNIIHISDEEYLEDDIISRLCTWLKVVYGEETLEVNLDFIAEALGNKGNTSREVIRNYFLNDFFKDHCQTYSVTGSGKRPIYWLFDSGKQNGFKALIYLHRYNADTIGNLRIDYLHRMQRIYESEIKRMQDTINNSTNAREVAAATKRKEKLTKQLKECREYDEKIAHLALSRIELDLDDGVKVNYKKLQTGVDGKFYEVLADSKNIMIKDK